VSTGKVVGAILSDMTEHPYDIVIAGIGITPATALAEAAGLEVDNGIKVDAQGRTSDPAIWAAGDCASFPYRGGASGWKACRTPSTRPRRWPRTCWARRGLRAASVVLVRPVRREAADRGAEHRL
jgi:NADPH-dependent glutamate synthase beta subunit-like oxidoreductase